MISSLDERIAQCPRPTVSAKVEREMVPPDLNGRMVPGVALSVVDDDRSPGGWVATVRWWLVHRKRWSWEPCSALDFVPILKDENVGRVRVRNRCAGDGPPRPHLSRLRLCHGPASMRSVPCPPILLWLLSIPILPSNARRSPGRHTARYPCEPRNEGRQDPSSCCVRSALA